MVDANNEDGCIVLGGSRDDDLLGTAADMESCGLFAGEDTSGLSDVISASFAPLDLSGIGLVENVNLVSVNSDSTVNLLDFSSVAAWYN